MAGSVDPARSRRSLYFVGLRKRVELCQLIVRYQWKLYLGLIAGVIGIVLLIRTELLDAIGIVLGFVGVVVGGVLMIPDVRDLTRSNVDIQMLAPPEDYRPPVTLRGGSGEIIRNPNKRT